VARQGAARQGEARRGAARRGRAGHGEARQGEARQGEARQGEFYKKIFLIFFFMGEEFKMESIVFNTQLPGCYNGRRIGLSYCKCDKCENKKCGFKNLCNITDGQYVDDKGVYFERKM